LANPEKSWIAPKNASFPDAPIFLIAIERLRRKSGTNRKKKKKRYYWWSLSRREMFFFQSVTLLGGFFKLAALVNSSQNWPWFDLVLESSTWLALKQQNDHLIASVLSEFKFGRYFYWTEVSKIRPWIFLWFFYLPCPTGALFIDIFEL
jgi:hypothetical protein